MTPLELWNIEYTDDQLALAKPANEPMLYINVSVHLLTYLGQAIAGK